MLTSQLACDSINMLGSVWGLAVCRQRAGISPPSVAFRFPGKRCVSFHSRRALRQSHGKPNGHFLKIHDGLPLGKMAERSEYGEGEQGQPSPSPAVTPPLTGEASQQQREPGSPVRRAGAKRLRGFVLYLLLIALTRARIPATIMSVSVPAPHVTVLSPQTRPT